MDVNKKLDYSSDTENILQIKISDLLPSGAKAEKFIVKLSASGNIGSPSISGGINVTNNDDYWLDLDGTQKISGSTGTIEFDVKSIQDYIQENGVFQIGYWWGEQNTVNIESVTCIYTDDSAVVTTAVTTKATTTSTATTTETATVETTITTTTTIPSSSDKTVTVNKLLDYTSDTEKILQVEISDLLPSGSKAEKFIVKISASGNIGTPQSAEAYRLRITMITGLILTASRASPVRPEQLSLTLSLFRIIFRRTAYFRLAIGGESRINLLLIQLHAFTAVRSPL